MSGPGEKKQKTKMDKKKQKKKKTKKKEIKKKSFTCEGCDADVMQYDRVLGAGHKAPASAIAGSTGRC